MFVFVYFFFFKQKTAYEMRISDWSSDGCSSDLVQERVGRLQGAIGDVQRCLQRATRLHVGQPGEAEPAGKVAIAQGRDIVAAQVHLQRLQAGEIGRASCRERVCKYV